MTNDEFEFLLTDRVAKIQAINKQLDLEHNSYISFSGGKDSTILHYLIDIALPNNKIPRVYANTGIEYNDVVKFVKELSKKDERFVILNQNKNIIQTLKKYGYPFKSKEHSLRVAYFNKGKENGYINLYINGIKRDETKLINKRYMCPKKLLYQFEEKGKYNYSNQCCYKLKKDLLHQWQKENNRKINITGMKNEEGGNRAKLTCLTNNNKSFHPLIVVSDEWENYFIKYYNIQLCKLYYPPYNFKRTGCKGCPFNLKIQQDLNTMYKLLPSEYKQCLHLWKPVYDEYIRIGYRLKEYPHLKGDENNG